MLEQAIIIDMPVDLFWEGEPSIYDLYINAYTKKLTAHYDEINTMAWLNGIYVQRAMISVLDGKKYKYPEKPLERARKNEELSPSEQQAEVINLHRQLKNWSAGFRGNERKGH